MSIGKMVELRVRVDESKIKRFREYVKEKHGKLYAALGLELGKAMDEYLDRRNYEDAHAHIHRTQNHRSERSKKIRPKGKKDNFHPAYANGGELKDRKFSDPKEPGISSSERTKRKIIRYLEESGMMEAASISENAVRRIIAQIAGHDKRTIDKYFCILEEEWLLPKSIERKHSWDFARSPHFKR